MLRPELNGQNPTDPLAPSAAHDMLAQENRRLASGCHSAEILLRALDPRTGRIDMEAVRSAFDISGNFDIRGDFESTLAIVRQDAISGVTNGANEFSARADHEAHLAEKLRGETGPA